MHRSIALTAVWALFAALAFASTALAAVEIEFVGQSPKFKVFTSDRPEDFFKITFGAIKELDSNGDAVVGRSIQSLASQRTTSWTETDVTLGNVTAKEVRMTFDLSESAHLQRPCGGGRPCGSSCSHFDQTRHEIQVVVFLVEDSTTVEYGNKTIDVPAGAVKFNVEGENWPFCDDANSLSVAVDVEVQPKSSDNDATLETKNVTANATSTSDAVETTEVTVPTGSVAVRFQLPEMALVDEAEANVTVAVEPTETSTKIEFVFPNFRKLYYDPTVGFAGETDETASLAAVSSAGNGASLAFPFLAVVVAAAGSGFV